MQHVEYYRSLCGSWTGVVRFVFSGRPEGFANRMQAFLLGFLGHVTMNTTLTEVSGTEFAHTTRVKRFGLTLFSSDERIKLHEDGSNFLLIGTQADFPGWPSRPLEAKGFALATSATYHFEVMGAPMEQVTSIVPDGLALTQTTTFMRAEAVLRRR